MRRVETKSSQHVAWETIYALREEELEVKTISNDRGVEFGKPSILERELKVPVFFARAYASYERGTVENTIGLVRQYLPKGCDLRGINQQCLSFIEGRLNERPRKMHGFQSAEEIHFQKNKKLVRSNKFYRDKAHRELGEDLFRLHVHLNFPDALVA